MKDSLKKAESTEQVIAKLEPLLTVEERAQGEKMARDFKAVGKE